MAGAASEALTLELRDVVVARLAVRGRSPDARLDDWRIRVVLDAVNAALSKHAKVMPTKLREGYGYKWPAFTQQIRATRNDAGHPTSVAPVTPRVGPCVASDFSRAARAYDRPFRMGQPRYAGGATGTATLEESARRSDGPQRR